MMKFKRLLAVSLVAALPIAGALHAEPRVAPPYPTPNLYPLAWEFSFEYGKPQRIVVETAPGKPPEAFWYMTYLVTNKTDREQMWLPVFEMMTDNGTVIQGDGKAISSTVFDAIKKRETGKLLESPTKVAGPIRIGDAEAKESVAIWAEPGAEMGSFSIFITGLSGEVRQFKKADGGSLVELKTGADFKGVEKDQLVILRKTLQLNYFINGDEVFPGEDEVNDNPKAWIMR